MDLASFERVKKVHDVSDSNLAEKRITGRRISITEPSGLLLAQ